MPKHATDALIRRYNAASREDLRRAIDRLANAGELERLGLLAPDLHARMRAMRIALKRPMRLYAIVDGTDAAGTRAEAHCADLDDADEFDVCDPDVERLYVLLPDLGVDEDTRIEIRLADARDDDPADNMSVTVNRASMRAHPAISGRYEPMRLLDWRVVERPAS